MNNKNKVRVIDELENEVYEFENLEDCCEFIGIERRKVTIYISQNSKFKGRYRIQLLEPIKKLKVSL